MVSFCLKQNFCVVKAIPFQLRNDVLERSSQIFSDRRVVPWAYNVQLHNVQLQIDGH